MIEKNIKNKKKHVFFVKNKKNCMNGKKHVQIATLRKCHLFSSSSKLDQLHNTIQRIQFKFTVDCNLSWGFPTNFFLSLVDDHTSQKIGSSNLLRNLGQKRQMSAPPSPSPKKNSIGQIYHQRRIRSARKCQTVIL